MNKICLRCNQINEAERTHCFACNAPLPAFAIEPLENAPPTNEVTGSDYSAKRMLGLVTGVFLFAVALTGFFMGMRAVMAVGGSCADGGPYQVRVPCPKAGGFLLVVFIWLGLGGYFLNAKSAIRGMPLWSGFFWTAGFVLLGGNFLQAGIQALRAEVVGASAIGLGLGLAFVAMGMGPPVMIGNARLLWNMLAGSEPADERKTSVLPPDRPSRPIVLGLHSLALAAGIWLGLWFTT